MKKIALYLFLLTIPLFSFTMHKYYTSLTQVNYIPNEKSLQLTTQIFIDDFENALRKETQESIELNTSYEPDTIDKTISNYLSKKITIKINNKLEKCTYLGKEYEDDIVYLYFEILNIDQINSIEIQNKLLFEIFKEQRNIVKLNINNTNKTYYFTTNNDKGLLNF